MSWWTAGSLGFALLLSVCATSASATIDASGVWYVHEEDPTLGGADYSERWVVTGTAVTIENADTNAVLGTGTIDLDTGAFVIAMLPRMCGVGPIVTIPCCASETRTGTTDGTEFQSIYEWSVAPTAYYCMPAQASVTGSRCAPTPADGCIDSLTPKKTKLLVDHRTGKQQVQWSFARGGTTVPSALGDPTTTDSYSVCVYDDADMSPELVLHATAQGGTTCGTKPCWKASGSGFTYKDRAGASDGITLLQIASGAEGKPKAKVRIVGEALAGGGPLALPVLVQLNSTTGACWEAGYGEIGAKKNDAERFIGTGGE